MVGCPQLESAAEPPAVTNAIKARAMLKHNLRRYVTDMLRTMSCSRTQPNHSLEGGA